jgi:serine/threonine protein kinase
MIKKKKIFTALMKKKRAFTDDEAMHYFTMILIGLHYLHSKGIVHRDLKPANILIEQLPGGLNFLKIGDFGISRVDIQEMKKKISDSLTLGGLTSPAYASPEIMLDNKATSTKLDMWALGIMLHQLVSPNKHPFENENHYVMIENIKNKEIKPAPLA